MNSLYSESYAHTMRDARVTVAALALGNTGASVLLIVSACLRRNVVLALFGLLCIPSASVLSYGAVVLCGRSYLPERIR